jgi:hypothetical protein
MRRIPMYFLGLIVLLMAIGGNPRAQDKQKEKTARAAATVPTGPRPNS